MPQTLNELPLKPGKPHLGFVGYGGFGQLAALHLSPYFDICAYDSLRPNARMMTLPEVAIVGFEQVALCDVVVLAVPVSEIRASCEKLAPLLRPGTVVVDVGSVKIAPVSDMIECLPDHVQIIGTHPLFGPQSAANGVAGLKLSLCPVRGSAWRNLRVFLRRQLGLKVYVCSANHHDRDAATVQGLTHLIAKVLSEIGPLPTEMTTASFDLLMQAVSMVQDDPPSVLHAIESANPYAADVRSAFFAKAAEIGAQFET
ncbi:prephenate dehydrogenase [Cognatishimia sp. WU-CL00825]|uniref:prephenate dehydrogenase n=1 Tax=Cognatishimia sp. WU-CL00825 TaxID=3127658 RepID=UPI003103B7B0